jgi:MFS family permease
MEVLCAWVRPGSGKLPPCPNKRPQDSQPSSGSSAFAGGIFGLLGGYLTDILGRRRVLTFSILLYAGAAFAAGFSTSIEMLLV